MIKMNFIHNYSFKLLLLDSYCYFLFILSRCVFKNVLKALMTKDNKPITEFIIAMKSSSCRTSLVYDITNITARKN